MPQTPGAAPPTAAEAMTGNNAYNNASWLAAIASSLAGRAAIAAAQLLDAEHLLQSCPVH